MSKLAWLSNRNSNNNRLRQGMTAGRLQYQCNRTDSPGPGLLLADRKGWSDLPTHPLKYSGIGVAFLQMV